MTRTQEMQAAQAAREAIRLELLAAGMRSAQFDLAGSANSVTSTRLQAVDAEGVVLRDEALVRRAKACLTQWVDATVPAWRRNEGGRSRIDWSLDLDALDQAHFDNVNFERRRILPGASGASDGWILAENATDATLLAMGDLAPKGAAARVRLMSALGALTERERSDQPRFLTEAQRATLIEAICSTRVGDHDDAWITDVVLHGYFGYFVAPDGEVVQKLANESLDQVVESMCGTAAGGAATDRSRAVRSNVIEALTCPGRLSALDAVVDDLGDQMLQSLGREGLIDYETGAEQPVLPVGS